MQLMVKGAMGMKVDMKRQIERDMHNLTEEIIAKALIDKKAITLNARSPFTFVSGIKSPIYTDNRKMIGFPKERETIVDYIVKKLEGRDYDVIAGTATAGIPWAAWVADKVKKPMAYIRSEKKGHGAGKQIEGSDVSGKKVMVVEDLISTGGSSMRSVEACREAGGIVDCIVAIFSYGFEKAEKKFEEGRCKAEVLVDFDCLVKTAEKMGAISSDELIIVLEWNKDPSGWGPKHGFA